MSHSASLMQLTYDALYGAEMSDRNECVTIWGQKVKVKVTVKQSMLETALSGLVNMTF